MYIEDYFKYHMKVLSIILSSSVIVSDTLYPQAMALPQDKN